MDSLLEQLRNLVAKVDDDGRRKVATALREMADSLETPHQTVIRILFGVCSSCPDEIAEYL
jgi:hypothetical protein